MGQLRGVGAFALQHRVGGPGAERSSSAVVIRRTWQSIPASSNVASASSAQVQSPPPERCHSPRGSSSSSRTAAARVPGVGGRAALVVDDGHLVARCAELPVGAGDENAAAQLHSFSRTGARSRSGSHQARLAAYHSTVARSPSSNEICGAQPSSRRSFAESSR